MKVLIAVDGSECSEQAIDFVAGNAWKEGSKFLVITVVQPVPREFDFLRQSSDVSDEYMEKIERKSEKIAKEAVKKIRKKLPDYEVEYVVKAGSAASKVIQVAKSWHANLIVVGSHGRKGFEKVFLGSVAEEIIKTAPCSVEVVRDCEH